MKIIKRIIYTILGLLLTCAVALVGVILYAEYSGSRFTKETIAALVEPDFSDGESRLVYDENGNIAELPVSVTATEPEDLSPSETFTETGSDTLATDTSDADAVDTADDAAAMTTATDSSEQPYVMDLDSALFHTTDCPYAANIATDNRSEMTTTREKIINAGYNACTNCNP